MPRVSCSSTLSYSTSTTRNPACGLRTDATNAIPTFLRRITPKARTVDDEKGNEHETRGTRHVINCKRTGNCVCTGSETNSARRLDMLHSYAIPMATTPPMRLRGGRSTTVTRASLPGFNWNVSQFRTEARRSRCSRQVRRGDLGREQPFPYALRATRNALPFLRATSYALRAAVPTRYELRATRCRSYALPVRFLASRDRSFKVSPSETEGPLGVGSWIGFCSVIECRVACLVLRSNGA